jgi:Family of unknown function (DUF5681)
MENNAKAVAKAKPPHRWKPGESGNPAGTKRGSRHRASLLAESLLDGETDRLTRRCIYEALKGDMQAMKLCLEQLLPPVRERPLPRKFRLPKLETLNNASSALATIIAGVTTGELLPGQSESLAAIVNSFLKSIELSEIETRWARLNKPTLAHRGRVLMHERFKRRLAANAGAGRSHVGLISAMISAVAAWHLATWASSACSWRTKAEARERSNGGGAASMGSTRRMASPAAAARMVSGFRAPRGAASSDIRLPRRYQVLRDIPSASHGRCAGFLGIIPCARRQRSERKRAFSRLSAAVMISAPLHLSRAGTLLRALPISTLAIAHLCSLSAGSPPSVEGWFGAPRHRLSWRHRSFANCKLQFSSCVRVCGGHHRGGFSKSANLFALGVMSLALTWVGVRCGLFHLGTAKVLLPVQALTPRHVPPTSKHNGGRSSTLRPRPHNLDSRPPSRCYFG